MKLNFKIIYLFILINTMISCHNESKEYNKSNENISILKNDSNNSNDSIILKKDNPVIIFQKESECIENCRNTELVLNKRLRNDTLFIKLAVVRPCKSKNTTQVTLDNDSLKFFIADYFGNDVTRNYWGNLNYPETSGFLGAITLPLLIYALFKSDAV